MSKTMTKEEAEAISFTGDEMLNVEYTAEDDPRTLVDPPVADPEN